MRWWKRFTNPDAYFMWRLAELSRESHDPHTKTACMVVSRWMRLVIVQAVNRTPTGVRVTPERIERPEKYFWLGHAEETVFHTAARFGKRLKKKTMYVNWYPCGPCARGVVNSGIARLVCDKQRTEERWHDPKWTADFERVKTLLQEAGVTVDLI
jgi:dCMP deaminase